MMVKVKMMMTKKKVMIEVIVEIQVEVIGKLKIRHSK